MQTETFVLRVAPASLVICWATQDPRWTMKHSTFWTSRPGRRPIRGRIFISNPLMRPGKRKYGGPRPELTSRHFLVWCVERKIELIYIQPGERKQNARVESFHERLGEERLTVSWFQNLFDVRRKIAGWRKEYNVERPHISLEYRTPQDFAAATRASEAGPALMAPPS